jgi:CubicO group peptidase (beta-lactamase class C family)
LPPTTALTLQQKPFMPSSPAAPSPSPVTFFDGLARAQPSTCGVEAGEIVAMLDDIAKAGLDVHGFMLHRHGKVVAEGWRWPYRADRLRILHSTTKSFLACAVGLAIEEGHLALTDKVVSFFPEELPEVVDERLAEMTVEDLLTMRTGHAGETSGGVWRTVKTSWIAEFFKIPLVHRPGTVYVYTSAASYMLAAVVTRATGTGVHAYLRPRLFEPLGIVGETWDIGPDGINPGGNGLTLHTADLLKLGILHAQGGVWEGRRLLPAAWAAEATRRHTGNEREYYGYHWNIRPKEAYSALGRFVQASIVYPAHNATLCVTGAIAGTRRLFPYVEAHLPAAFHDAPLDNPAGDALLAARLADWQRTLPLPGEAVSALASTVSGVQFDIEPNTLGVASLQLEFSPQQCLVRLTDGEGPHELVAGIGRWAEGTTSMPGEDLHHSYQLANACVVAAGGWVDPSTFRMQWIFAETAFTDTIVVRFDGDKLTWERSVNINGGATSHPRLIGRRTGRA